MAEIVVVPLGDGQTRVTHPPSGTSFDTDSSPEWGGRGRSFSATDLVAAALGACIGSSIASVLERRGVQGESVEIRVSKTLASDPKRIDHLRVTISVAGGADDALRTVILRAASTCAVGRSLDAPYDITVE